jgi:hypothetical protein
MTKKGRTRRIIKNYYGSKTLEDYDNLKIGDRDLFKKYKT